MKILITGVAGFIGFHTAQALLTKGYKIIGIDNLNDYYDVTLKKNRLAELKRNGKHENFVFLEMNVAERRCIERLFQEYQFDFVIHLAAQAGVRYSIENPHAYVDSNVVGFVNILEGCRTSQVKHLVYASSSSVYGMNTKIPFETGDRVDSPVSFYAATKRSNELMAYSYSHLYNIPVTGLRLFTVYGPWGRPDMAYFSFTKKILEGEVIDVFNNGDMERDFTYVDDVVEGIVRVVCAPPVQKITDTTTARARHKIYNIGNDQPIALNRFIQAIEKATGKQAVRCNKPMQPGDVPRTYADITELIVEVGYKPSVSIEEGIAKFVAWYKEYYGA